MVDKASEKEEEWIKEQELKRLKLLKPQIEEGKKAEELKRLKELHWMHCPKCGQELETLEHHNINLDRCPACEGIWLDKGELEALISFETGQHKTFFDTIKGIFR